MQKYLSSPVLCLMWIFILSHVPSLEAAQMSNRIVAVVNGTMISMYDLEQVAMPQIMRSNLDLKKPQDKPRTDQILQAALNSLIDEIIIAQAAEARGIKIADDMVNTEFSRLAERSGLDTVTFSNELRRQGVTEADIKQKIRNGLLQNRLLMTMVERKVVVTDEDIDAFLANNSEFVAQDTNQRVTIGLLIYPPSINAKLMAERVLSGNLTFEKAVQEFSVGPNTSEGGNIGEITLLDLDPVMLDHLRPLKSGQVTQLFEINGMQAQAKLLGKVGEDESTPAQATALNREAAEQTLRKTKSQERFQEYMKEIRMRAVIDNRL